MFSDCFDMLMSKIILKKLKKKLHFNIFLNEKNFELSLLPQSQTHSSLGFSIFLIFLLL
jgi:hypothetical protein